MTGIGVCESRKDLEQIIGIGQDSMGYTAAVLLMPMLLGDPPNPPAVPEPTSIACALFILAGSYRPANGYATWESHSLIAL